MRQPYVRTLDQVKVTRALLSKLFRNVPTLSSLEMSPFFDFGWLLFVDRWPCLQRSLAEPEGRSA